MLRTSSGVSSYSLLLEIGSLSIFLGNSKNVHVKKREKKPEKKTRVQGLHPATRGICFSVVPCSNRQSCFVNSQLMYLLPDGIFNHVTPFIFEILFPLFQWCTCRLAKVSACIANYMSDVNKIYIFYNYKRGKVTNLWRPWGLPRIYIHISSVVIWLWY